MALHDKAWKGRFTQGPSAAMEDFHSSLRFDHRLWRQDIRGSRAHAAMLYRQGILKAEDAAAIDRGLAQVEAEMERGVFDLAAQDDEDIHMAVERRLTEIIGAAGGRLHTARSRNDQVVTDVRLWLRDTVDRQLVDLDALLGALLEKAKATRRLILPGTTHSQPAQPMRLGFWHLAWFWMFERDRQRLADARRRINRSPLGSGAFAGVNWPVDRAWTASMLGFDGPMENAMDGVADRDFAAEYLSAAAIFLVHVSRLCEEIVAWSNPQFGYLTLSEAFSTGSSIMPNKRNPDAAELARGKSGRLIGDLVALLTAMKGLPLAYNKDLQEDKEALFDGADTVDAVLSVLGDMIATAVWHESPMRIACEKGFLQATDLADDLAAKGLPFREAHHVVAALVRDLSQDGRTFADLKPGELEARHPLFDVASRARLDLEAVVENKRSAGGTSLAAVDRQIEEAERRLARS